MVTKGVGDLPGPKFRATCCNTIIQSQHRHDMVWCACGKIAVDGGDAYTRTAGDQCHFERIPDDAPDTSGE